MTRDRLIAIADGFKELLVKKHVPVRYVGLQESWGGRTKVSCLTLSGAVFHSEFYIDLSLPAPIEWVRMAILGAADSIVKQWQATLDEHQREVVCASKPEEQSNHEQRNTRDQTDKG